MVSLNIWNTGSATLEPTLPISSGLLPFILRRAYMEHSTEVGSINLLITQAFLRAMVAHVTHTFMCPPWSSKLQLSKLYSKAN